MQTPHAMAEADPGKDAARHGPNISEAPSELGSDEAYLRPTLVCDLVMKGGITSGVTYPLAVCEIARTYRLRNIGGTSAGAIAAAAAAASEVGRDVAGAGFARLSDLPRRLAASLPGRSGSVLFDLFQPSATTRPLFGILSAALRSRAGGKRRAWNIVWAAITGTPVAAVAGGAIGAVTVGLLISAIASNARIRSSPIAVAAVALGILAGVVALVAGALGAVTVSLLVRGLGALAGNRFGMCSGFVPGDPLPAGSANRDDLQRANGGELMPKPLTTWLADELDALAGKADPFEPLTLGDLAASGVNLKMFTTNLTDGTPYTLPFRNRSFFFDPNEFGELFPERVVRWMTEPANRPVARNDHERNAFALMERNGQLPLPDAAKLPVVVMARLSLSFPVLLSAVPMWSVRLTEATEATGDAGAAVQSAATPTPTPTPTPERCWFSDGGITSNFPIHFFDGPLPRWPTFGINLGPTDRLDPTDERRNIWAPMTNGGGISARWGAIDGMIPFVRAIADTVQNWSDNAQIRVPGYRDRIVVIKHTKAEGGLNLNMDPALIERLGERGRCAGAFLVNRFAHTPSRNGPGDHLSWENHRWLRYRSLMPLVETLLTGLVTGYDWVPSPDGQRTYRTLIGAPVRETPSYHWLAHDQQPRAARLTDQLLVLGRAWGGLPEPVPSILPAVDLSLTPIRDPWDPHRPFEANAPRPRPVLRILRDF
jgi:Patatin-like phospholipase